MVLLGVMILLTGGTAFGEHQFPLGISVIIGGIILTLFIYISRYFEKKYFGDVDIRDFNAMGIAEVLEMEEVGDSNKDFPEIRFLLKVSRVGKAQQPFVIEHTQAYDKNRVFVGAQLPLMVDNKKNVRLQ
ncbi:MAG: hypothetical protein FJ150_01380 [Euryarchaeota archaeon]|nr:hypothetical protein [Euryarchaeota archaeon]